MSLRDSEEYRSSALLSINALLTKTGCYINEEDEEDFYQYAMWSLYGILPETYGEFRRFPAKSYFKPIVVNLAEQRIKSAKFS
jgi:hypothetical protein